MSLDIVACPLTSFGSSREFVGAIADTMEGRESYVDLSQYHTNSLLPAAHQHAHFRAQILHRDISVGNILITDEGKGLLISV